MLTERSTFRASTLKEVSRYNSLCRQYSVAFTLPKGVFHSQLNIQILPHSVLTEISKLIAQEEGDMGERRARGP